MNLLETMQVENYHQFLGSFLHLLWKQKIQEAEVVILGISYQV